MLGTAGARQVKLDSSHCDCLHHVLDGARLVDTDPDRPEDPWRSSAAIGVRSRASGLARGTQERSAIRTHELRLTRHDDVFARRIGNHGSDRLVARHAS